MMVNQYEKRIIAILSCLGISFMLLISSDDYSQVSIRHSRILLSQLPSAAAEKQAPIIYTFFDDLDNVVLPKDTGKLTDSRDKQIIRAWEDAWSSMGYIPRILTMKDAKRNPDFEAYSSILDSKVPLGSNIAYEKACFLRWLAMATTDGGFFSDFDTIPLMRPQPEDLVPPETFTLYQGKVPSLMRGTKDQWKLISKEIMEQALNAQRKQVSQYSDMLALDDLIVNPDKKHLFHVHFPHVVALGSMLLKKEWKGCHHLAKFRAVHFQHASELVKNPLVDELLRDSQYQSHRATFMAKWANYWPTYYKELCGMELPQSGTEIMSTTS